MNNNLPEAFNVAALAEARKINPEIPENAFPIMIMNTVSLLLNEDELAFGDHDVPEVAEMYMPTGWQAIAFSTHDGEEWNEEKWVVALDTTKLTKSYDDDVIQESE